MKGYGVSFKEKDVAEKIRKEKSKFCLRKSEFWLVAHAWDQQVQGKCLSALDLLKTLSLA